MRTQLVAGNWKMHGTRARARQLADAVVRGLPQAERPEVVLCPPYVYMTDVAQILVDSTVGLGAQNICEATAEGAYTGEVSGGMLRDCGCHYVIVGHSERRTLYSESDALVARKFAAARAAGLIPVLCVGESQAERGADATRSVILRQIDAVIASVGIDAFAGAVVAYEPIWAIGTGKMATPTEAQEVHRLIRTRIVRDDAKIADGLRVIYGGSVKASNAADLFGQPDIDGALVGGASLDAGEFLAICGAASEVATS